MDISLFNKPEGALATLGGQGWVELNAVHGSEVDIVAAARVAYGRRDEHMSARDVRLLKRLYESRHTVPFEFVDVQYTLYCPLIVRSQLVRHRTCSFVELSRRYVKDGFAFYNPGGQCQEEMARHYEVSLALYHKLLAKGIQPEVARGALPQNLMTLLKLKSNLHNFMHLLDLRTSEKAQSETREYADAMRRLLAPRLPYMAAIRGWAP